MDFDENVALYICFFQTRNYDYDGWEQISGQYACSITFSYTNNFVLIERQDEERYSVGECIRIKVVASMSGPEINHDRYFRRWRRNPWL